MRWCAKCPKWYNTKKTPILFPSCLPHHTVFPSWPLQWALPLLNNLLPPRPPSCLCCSQTLSSIMEETGKSLSGVLSSQRAFWWRTIAISMSTGVHCTLCCRRRLHADPPLIHQKRVYFYKLKYHPLFTAKMSSLCWYLFCHCFDLLSFFPTSSILRVFFFLSLLMPQKKNPEVWNLLLLHTHYTNHHLV